MVDYLTIGKNCLWSRFSHFLETELLTLWLDLCRFITDGMVMGMTSIGTSDKEIKIHILKDLGENLEIIIMERIMYLKC